MLRSAATPLVAILALAALTGCSSQADDGADRASSEKAMHVSPESVYGNPEGARTLLSIHPEHYRCVKNRKNPTMVDLVPPTNVVAVIGSDGKGGNAVLQGDKLLSITPSDTDPDYFIVKVKKGAEIFGVYVTSPTFGAWYGYIPAFKKGRTELGLTINKDEQLLIVATDLNAACPTTPDTIPEGFTWQDVAKRNLMHPLDD